MPVKQLWLNFMNFLLAQPSGLQSPSDLECYGPVDQPLPPQLCITSRFLKGAHCLLNQVVGEDT